MLIHFVCAIQKSNYYLHYGNGEYYGVLCIVIINLYTTAKQSCYLKGKNVSSYIFTSHTSWMIW